MLPALAFLACFVPPSVFAALPPRTPAWRKARKVYWMSLPVGAAWFAVNVAVLDPAGPAVLYYGSWFGFVLVATAWAWATGTIRSEWSEWREHRRREREATPRVLDPNKPWLK